MDSSEPIVFQVVVGTDRKRCQNRLKKETTDLKYLEQVQEELMASKKSRGRTMGGTQELNDVVSIKKIISVNCCSCLLIIDFFSLLVGRWRALYTKSNMGTIIGQMKLNSFMKCESSKKQEKNTCTRQQ